MNVYIYTTIKFLNVVMLTLILGCASNNSAPEKAKNKSDSSIIDRSGVDDAASVSAEGAAAANLGKIDKEEAQDLFTATEKSKEADSQELAAYRVKYLKEAQSDVVKFLEKYNGELEAFSVILKSCEIDAEVYGSRAFDQEGCKKYFKYIVSNNKNLALFGVASAFVNMLLDRGADPYALPRRSRGSFAAIEDVLSSPTKINILTGVE